MEWDLASCKLTLVCPEIGMVVHIPTPYILTMINLQLYQSTLQSRNVILMSEQSQGHVSKAEVAKTSVCSILLGPYSCHKTLY